MSDDLAYICPDCKSKLLLEENSYLCTSCSKKYPIIENIPLFSPLGIYYGETNQKDMTELIETSQKYGYEKAVLSIVKDSFVLKYILDENRALWANLLSLDANTEFLDVGCGWGSIAIPLARKVGRVSAVDITFERVKFVQLRANENGLSNITPALASATSLPYPNNSFNIVAFNGVLEWLGAISEEEKPKILQIQALSEAFRVLKPGGIIYIGIENRFSLRYFLGDKDDHSFIRFTSLMPRWLSRVYYKLRRGRNYFMHTYSLFGYRKMLQQIGFSAIKEYYPWPNYRTPSEFVELNKIHLIAFFRKKILEYPVFSRKWIYLVLLKLLTVLDKKGLFCHSYVFIYEKPK